MHRGRAECAIGAPIKPVRKRLPARDSGGDPVAVSSLPHLQIGQHMSPICCLLRFRNPGVAEVAVETKPATGSRANLAPASAFSRLDRRADRAFGLARDA